MFGDADGIPVVLCEASGRCPPASRSREGEGTPEDILARLADGKHRLEANEFKLISHGTYFKAFLNVPILKLFSTYVLNKIAVSFFYDIGDYMFIII